MDGKGEAVVLTVQSTSPLDSNLLTLWTTRCCASAVHLIEVVAFLRKHEDSPLRRIIGHHIPKKYCCSSHQHLFQEYMRPKRRAHSVHYVQKSASVHGVLSLQISHRIYKAAPSSREQLNCYC